MNQKIEKSKRELAMRVNEITTLCREIIAAIDRTRDEQKDQSGTQ